jgi:hypothetical protein
MSDEKRLAELDARLARMESALQRIPHVFDPPPDDWGWLSRWFRFTPVIPLPPPRPEPGDPPTVDLSRLSRVQLELALANVKAERIRLDALEHSIGQQLKQIG